MIPIGHSCVGAFTLHSYDSNSNGLENQPCKVHYNGVYSQGAPSKLLSGNGPLYYCRVMRYIYMYRPYVKCLFILIDLTRGSGVLQQDFLFFHGQVLYIKGPANYDEKHRVSFSVSISCSNAIFQPRQPCSDLQRHQIITRENGLKIDSYCRECRK